MLLQGGHGDMHFFMLKESRRSLRVLIEKFPSLAILRTFVLPM